MRNARHVRNYLHNHSYIVEMSFLGMTSYVLFFSLSVVRGPDLCYHGRVHNP